MPDDDLRRRADAGGGYTYEEVAATRTSTLPAGYDHVRRTCVVGRGAQQFRASAEALLRWEVHRGAGLTVRASAERASPGVEVVVGLGIGPFRVQAPCRVVYTVEEPHRRGFAYGTLAGHPARGEELFLVELRDDGDVALTVAAFSTPALWWSRLGAPVTRRVQGRITDRYVRAVEQLR